MSQTINDETYLSEFDILRRINLYRVSTNEFHDHIFRERMSYIKEESIFVHKILEICGFFFSSGFSLGNVYSRGTTNNRINTLPINYGLFEITNILY